MPRDKSATHERLIPLIREEFLTYGYEKASLQHIASRAGITAAGLYRHFPGKEAMFSSLVEPTVETFRDYWEESMKNAILLMSEKDFVTSFNNFRMQNSKDMMNFVYDHYDALKLLLVKAKGTKWENFEDRLVEKEMESVLTMFRIMDRKGIQHNRITEEETHILCTTFIAAMTEAIKHDYTRKEAMNHIDFVARMLYPGIRDILGF